MKYTLCLVAFSIILSSCKGPGVKLLGKDRYGHMIEQNIPESNFKNEFAPVIKNLHEQSLSSISKLDVNSTDWELNEIRVGAQIAGDVGLKKISSGASSGIMLVYMREQ
jgi:hypothetical protein